MIACDCNVTRLYKFDLHAQVSGMAMCLPSKALFPLMPEVHYRFMLPFHVTVSCYRFMLPIDVAGNQHCC